MSSSATRLTCFALLSAVEEDLRLALIQARASAPLTETLPDDALTEAQRRYQRDRGTNADTTDLAEILPYVDYQVACDALLGASRDVDPRVADFLATNSKALHRLTGIRNRVAHTRPLEIDDLPLVLDTAETLHRFRPLDTPQVDDTLKRLSEEPAFVFGLEVRFANLPANPTRRHNLPIPDFDETGYIGRKALIATLHRRIRGAYPVVSLVGDGGVGKTALALKVAYEILDAADNPFDAIVWTTAKTSMLTVGEIRRIEGAVADSLGLLGVAARELGAPSGSDPLLEVREYLSHFKVLLILDNLETVLDDRLREFLSELPMGSKVLITSRVGFGTLESIKVDSLEHGEAVALLRSLGRLRNVPAIQKADSQAIDSFVDKMGAHPLFIKWFVSAVQSGQRPEDVLANDLILDFCMSNVYNFLQDNARLVLRSLQALPGRHNQAELCYLNELEVADLQESLLQLMSTNFLSMRSVAVGNAVASEYELSEFAAKYLDRQHPISDDERRWLVDRQSALSEYGARIRADSEANPFEPYSLDIRGPGDFSTAALLMDALTAIYAGETPAAREKIHAAIELAPDYHECFRVEAMAYVAEGNVAAASAAFERALELHSDSALLRYFYGEFLLRDALQPGEALRQFQRAARIDADNAAILGGIVRSYQLLARHEEARDAALAALSHAEFPPEVRTRFLDAFLNALVSDALRRWELGDVPGLVEVLEDVSRVDEHGPGLVGDATVRDRAQHALQLAQLASRRTGDAYLLKVSDNVQELLRAWLRPYGGSQAERTLGRVEKMVPEKGFGFIRPIGAGSDIFFHCSQVVPKQDFDKIQLGSEVSFRRGVRSTGEQALDVWVLG